MSNKLIPDISHHDPVASWTKVKDQCSFLIFKGTQGTYYVDPTLKKNIEMCEKYKIPYWAYSFVTKGNELAQAKYLVSMCKNKIGKCFVGYVIDIERQSKPEDVQIALNWLNKQGYKTMLYTQYYEYEKYKDVIKNRGSNCAWWEPRYGPNDGKFHIGYPCHQGVDLHQYTEKGTVEGIKGKVDLNLLTGMRPLVWFTTPLLKDNKKIEEIKIDNIKTIKKEYSGTYPIMPSRGYYQKGDGIKTLTNYPTQLKRMQQLLNWIDDSTKDITVDGQFGQNTENKLRTTQKILGVPITGKFDQATLKAARAFRK